jgi:hypothetical protein
MLLLYFISDIESSFIWIEKKNISYLEYKTDIDNFLKINYYKSSVNKNFIKEGKLCLLVF